MSLVIYTLELGDDKIYVGASFNVVEEVKTHFTKPEVEWVRTYKAVSVAAVKKSDIYDVDVAVISLMKAKGIDNVRGGSFSETRLSKSQKTYITEIIKNYDEDLEEVVRNTAEDLHYKYTIRNEKFHTQITDAKFNPDVCGKFIIEKNTTQNTDIRFLLKYLDTLYVVKLRYNFHHSVDGLNYLFKKTPLEKKRIPGWCNNSLLVRFKEVSDKLKI